MDGRVIVNGKPLNELYARGRSIPSTEEAVTLGKREFFVIGDNRDVSEYGRVEHDEILGKVLF